MTLETSLIDSAVRNWRSNVDRAGNLFGNLPQEQLLQEVAPGKNRLIYLWGHLTAFSDALIPLLGFGDRIHPELDLMFVSNPDRTVPTILLGEDLKIIWQNGAYRLSLGPGKALGESANVEHKLKGDHPPMRDGAIFKRSRGSKQVE